MPCGTFGSPSELVDDLFANLIEYEVEADLVGENEGTARDPVVICKSSY